MFPLSNELGLAGDSSERCCQHSTSWYGLLVKERGHIVNASLKVCRHLPDFVANNSLPRHWIHNILSRFIQDPIICPTFQLTMLRIILLWHGRYVASASTRLE